MVDCYEGRIAIQALEVVKGFAGSISDQNHVSFGETLILQYQFNNCQFAPILATNCISSSRAATCGPA
jgi:hypothetical protein